MAWEQVWDLTWERVSPGHYINSGGTEIIKSDRGWVLSTPFGNEDETFRTLKAAQAAADKK